VNLVLGQDARVASWVAREVDADAVPPFTAIGWEHHGVIVAGVVFNGFTGADVEMTLAWHAPLTRQAIRTISQYVFEQLGVRRVSIRTRASRRDVVDQAQRLGFKIEGHHPHLFQDDDGVSLGLLRADCRWLGVSP
jgi:RimJ/RimL family protein N-acetyltransferase